MTFDLSDFHQCYLDAVEKMQLQINKSKKISIQENQKIMLQKLNQFFLFNRQNTVFRDLSLELVHNVFQWTHALEKMVYELADD